jgi:hypothetical protein
MHDYVNLGVVDKYQGVQLRGARIFLQSLLREGDGGDIGDSLRRFDHPYIGF